MIDDVVAVLRPEHDRDHVLAEKLLSLHFALGTPALALLLDLPNADRHLGRAQVCDRNGLENGCAKRHGGLLKSANNRSASRPLRDSRLRAHCSEKDIQSLILTA